MTTRDSAYCRNLISKRLGERAHLLDTSGDPVLDAVDALIRIQGDAVKNLEDDLQRQVELLAADFSRIPQMLDGKQVLAMGDTARLGKTAAELAAARSAFSLILGAAAQILTHHPTPHPRSNEA